MKTLSARKIADDYVMR